MADLAQALAGMFSGGDMTIFQATVDAVGEGVVTVHSNGGNFTDVPYLPGGFAPQLGPFIGDTVYVIGRKDWGLLVLGKPAPGPNRSIADPQVLFWEPFTLAAVNRATGAWTVPGNGEVRTTPGPQGVAAVFFFSMTNRPLLPLDYELSNAAFFLDAPSFDTGGMGVDYNYVTIGLHANDTPAGAFAPLANLDGSWSASQAPSLYTSISLDWAVRLINGSAKGVYVQTEEWPTIVRGPGTVRLTTL